MVENKVDSSGQGKEETLNMKELGNIVFPHLDAVTAERKASATFKRTCKQLGIEPSSFRSGKEYNIPRISLPMWTLLLRNINAVEGNPSQNGYMNFVEDVIYTKSEVDEQFNDLKNNEVDFQTFQESMTTIYELFYTSTSHGQSIAMILHNELMQRIENDLKYIRENAPTDRTVFYTEWYYKEINQKAEKMSGFIRKMINEKWHEQ